VIYSEILKPKKACAGQPLRRNLGLTDAEKSDLIQYLLTLKL
jgi:hypothetical protein